MITVWPNTVGAVSFRMPLAVPALALKVTFAASLVSRSV